MLWEASSFGVKPVMVLKGGVVAWTAIGEGNASVHGAEPTLRRPGRRGRPRAVRGVRDVRVGRVPGRRHRRRPRDAARLVPVRGTRTIRRADLARNRTAPIEVSPEDGTVTLDGAVLRSDLVGEVPLSRRYLLA